MSLAGCSAMALGNREFELFAPALRRELSRARFPVVCTNMTHPRPDRVPVRSQVTLLVGDRRVRVLGALRDMTAGFLSRGLSGFRFQDPVASLTEAVSDAEPSELVVVLSHLGQETDLRVLETVPRIDFVLGGHDHVGWCAIVSARAAVAPEPLGRQVAVIRVPDETEPPDVRLVRPDDDWGCG
jgi:5'-nucleotidase